MLQETGILGVPRQPDVVLTGEQQRRLRIILLGVLLETRPRAQPANAEHPGAEHDAESGKTAQDLGAWVLLKRPLELGLAG